MTSINNLKGKRILFIAASFFGYETEIIKKLTELGAKVDFYDERPKNTFWYKALIRINKKIMKIQIQKYYEKILKETSKNNYDCVFFIKAEVISLPLLKKLKRVHSEIPFILYLWDSLKNNKGVFNLLPEFDRVFSFDMDDVDKYSFMQFRPLFFLDDYNKIANTSSSYEYDISFVGTGHTDRYKILTKVKKECEEKKLKGFWFLYLQDYKIFFLKKYFDRNFEKAKLAEFSFKPINKYETINIFEKSKCILDIERSIQKGLTMRTIETLGAKRKLITTNVNICKYDFYKEENVMIIDRDNPKISSKFLSSKFSEIEIDIYNKYTLKGWIYDIFKNI